jgi:hydroxymethylpyrimidine pyrophosphatase-like HAD family hydrolase
MIQQRLPPPRTIAVDVDGTLHREGISNTRLILWLEEQKAAGYSLMLWSMRGEEHARRVASHCNAEHLFDLICSKPGYVVDDQGWQWIKETKIITNFGGKDQ